jgi:hypothetical protein
MQIIAGTGDSGFSGDGGSALSARLGDALDVAIDAEGNVFFSEDTRIRAIRYGAVLAPPSSSVQAVAIGSTVRATVFDSNGNPAPSVRVDFTAPTSGASCVLSSGFAVTDANGAAAVNCTANCIAGSYVVTAQPLAATSMATVTLTNVASPCRHRAVRH